MALSSLPVLHEIQMDDEANCEAGQLSALRKDLTPWDEEFKSVGKGKTPSLDLQIVDQQTFDHYDSKAPHGVRPDECDDGMLRSEREWLLEAIRESLSVFLEEETDFHLPYTSGRRRSERVILYSMKACESFREVALAVQRILCETRNDWIIWAQALPSEGPDESEDLEDFVTWIYTDKILATQPDAKAVRNLIEWKRGK